MAITTTTTSDVKFYSIIFIIWLVSTLLIRSFANQKRKSKTTIQHHHPPSPPSLPITGHLHLLGSILPKSFQALASRYGPLTKLSFGSSPAILVSSDAAAKQLLKTHELNFVSRPSFGASDYNIYRGSEFVNAEYGTYWRFMKKLCMTELLSSPQIKRFVDIRREEMMNLLGILANYSKEGKVCDLGKEIMTVTNNVTCRMAMSTRCCANADESKEIWRLVKGMLEIAPKFSLGELLGPLGKLDLFGYGRKLKELMMEFDDLVERVIKEHEERNGGGAGGGVKKDMMDILLEISRDETAEVKITRKDIKSFLMEIFMAGTETISVALQWTMAEIINHPEVFKKLRDEINDFVGPRTRLVEESDVPNLPYLQAVVKEALRLHAPAPLIFRKCMEDCKINGYDVLKDSRIIINVYGIMRDPNSWENPTEFLPDRFVGSSTEKHYMNQVDIKGRNNFNYLPFGSGRRGCPGAALTSTVMHLMIATLVQCFDWKVHGGEKFDVEEGLGLSSAIAHPLMCYPITHFNFPEKTHLKE